MYTVSKWVLSQKYRVGLTFEKSVNESVISVNTRKAFDKIQHEFFITHSRLGINDDFFNFIKSYH